ncbi:hypothetical protein Ga0609869_003230 [Rhodovulum iodosum]|uniref:VPLPA-CTERM sorting domain-containing protein n=1 Tax=Rhodovulum iodosum TaxID=68291 RepID=A0ABV3XWZ0_9RHOB|nr:VPLPA-CTERM sorting domain-containing protein [Rhodovulum robiginosum]RSK34089.1 hypothetical protein EJA01_08140 [Rhodovulum robiginosum]
MSIFRPALAVLVALATPLSAQAATTLYTDVASFTAGTGATAQPALPFVGVFTGSETVGDLTFTNVSGNTIINDTTWSTLIPGREVAISGREDLDIGFAAPLSAFGFYAHEPSTSTGVTDGCNTTCVPSLFSLTLYSGAATVGSVAFNIPDDTLAFFGLSSTLAFDRVELRETTGTADNEFFGGFYTAPAQVPVPPAAPLLAMALGGLALLRRR